LLDAENLDRQGIITAIGQFGLWLLAGIGWRIREARKEFDAITAVVISYAIAINCIKLNVKGG